MNNICTVINKNHRSIRSTFFVCINYVWFTLDQQVLLPISCTQSSLANFTDTHSHAGNMIRKQFRYISRLFFYPFPMKLCRNVEKSSCGVF